MKLTGSIIASTYNSIAPGKNCVDVTLRIPVNGSRRPDRPPTADSELGPEAAASFKNKPATIEVSDDR